MAEVEARPRGDTWDDPQPTPPAVDRYTIAIWKTTARGEESVLWYAGPFRVALDSQPDRLVITVHRRAEGP